MCKNINMYISVLQFKYTMPQFFLSKKAYIANTHSMNKNWKSDVTVI